MFNHSDPNSPHFFSKMSSRGNSNIYMLAIAYRTGTLSTATLEGKECMKLEKTRNNIKRKYLSCTYIATLLLKQSPRATKGDISLLSLQLVALAILYQLMVFQCRLEYLYVLYILHSSSLRPFSCVILII